MKKPYRSPEFNDERKWKAKNLLDDVVQVGKQKAIGYVCISDTILLEDLETMFPTKLTYYKADRLVPVFYVGDMGMMQKIIDHNKDLLIKNNWSLNAVKVFDRVCREDVAHEENPDMYHFIADLFNSWCLWCEKPIWVAKKNQPLSEHPYDPDTNR